jgi:hypothetical protein
MAQAVSRRPPTAEAWVRSGVGPCGICGGQSGTGTGLGGLGPIPGQSMWDLWWTKWHWDRFGRPGFDPGSVHVGFVVDKVTLGQIFPCQFHSTRVPLLGKG